MGTTDSGLCLGTTVSGGSVWGLLTQVALFDGSLESDGSTPALGQHHVGSALS